MMRAERNDDALPAVEIGKTYRVRYPFVLAMVDLPDPDPEGPGFYTTKSWRPGVEHGNDDNGDGWSAADGHGEMLLTVVDVHKPGRFPARVFFTRQWQDPAGKVFGKGKLHIMTLPAFKRRLGGYLHEYYDREANGDA